MTNAITCKQRKRSGFTLVEILLVIVILGIIAGVAMPKIAGTGNKARIGATKYEINNLGQALDMFEMENGQYPQSLQGLLSNPGLQNWDGPYLKDKKLPEDPWGNPYSYSLSGDSYIIKSGGPPGQGKPISSED